MRIDWWTLALQTVNVLILIWILARFFFRPIANIVAERRKEANTLMADASAALLRAAHAGAEAEQARAEIGAERERLIAEARASAQAEKANLLAQASQETAKLREDAKSAIARDRMAAEQAILARASELAVDIARRLLERLPPKVVQSAFLDGICQELRALSAEDREDFASVSATDHAIVVITAQALCAEETGSVRDALRAALGAEVPFEFRADPALIAGLEIHGRNAIMRNHWREDLDQIRQELGRDQHSARS